MPDSCRRAGGWKLGKRLRSEGVFADAQARVRRKDADRCAGTGTPAARSLSNLDIAMLCYLAAIFVSWLFSVDRAAAWTGTDGWSMGLRTQSTSCADVFSGIEVSDLVERAAGSTYAGVRRRVFAGDPAPVFDRSPRNVSGPG